VRFLPEVAVSVLLLVPCFWQSRIQAGDLLSHIYNAWLAREIQRGTVEGLTLTTPWTNVLFDFWLVWLLRLCGPAAAQRIAVAAAVLIFTWGAFLLISRVNGRRAWPLMPCIAVLAYGWVFHAGLFNFYLSLGLCLWALALWWRPWPLGVAAAGLVLGLAWLAHALPVVWAVGAAVYLRLAERLPTRVRLLLLASAAGAVGAMSWALTRFYPHSWDSSQVLLILGVDQVWVYGRHYLWLSLSLLLVWTLFGARLVEEYGWSRLLVGVPFHWLALTSFGILLTPGRLDLSGYHHALVFVAQRMSLAAGVLICVILGAARPPRWMKVAAMAVAAAYFICLWKDTRELNALEDRMELAVGHLPARQRVVSAVCRSGERLCWATAHLIDRVCIDRCYSYANYEPSTGQFRVRALQDNPVVVSSYGDSWELQNGTYRVRPRDLPLFQVYTCGPLGDAFCVRELAVGEVAAVACQSRAAGESP
jgi:hypothetical protein